MTTQEPENSIREPVGTPMALVPTFLAPLAKTPEPKQGIPFWRAFFLYPLKRKWGPHLANGSTARACAAFLLALFGGIVLGIIAYLVASGAFGSNPLGLRGQLALSIRDCILVSFRHDIRASIGSWILAAPLYGTGGLLALSLLMAPAVEAGDGILSACNRSINNSLWTMTVMPWCGVIAIVLYAIQQIIDANIAHTGVLSWLELLIHNYTIAVLLGVISFALLMRTWLAGIAKYVGTAKGPGFQPRRPHCEDCGYLIGGLPMESRCPECGLAVRESMPGGRRAELARVASKLSVFRPGDYLQFWGTMLRRRSAIRRVPMHDERAARRFLWIGYLYGALAAEVVLVPMWLLAQSWNDRTAIVVTAAAIVAIVAFPILQIFLVLGAIVSGRVRYGIDDIRVCKTVANYSAVAYGPIAVVVVLECVVAFIQPLRGLMITVLGWKFDAIGIPAIALGVIGIYFAIEQSRRCNAGLRAAALANS